MGEEVKKEEEEAKEEVKEEGNEEEDAKGEEEKKEEAKGEEEKKEEPKTEEPPAPLPPVMLQVDLHCVGCAKKIQRSILKCKGVEGVEVEMGKKNSDSERDSGPTSAVQPHPEKDDEKSHYYLSCASTTSS